MLVHQAYRFELDPSNAIASALASSAGAARFAYNWALALVKTRLDQRARMAELLGTEGLSDRDAWALAASSVEVPWTCPALRREWNRAKNTVAPWWAANSKECYSSALDALARGLKAHSDSRYGRRRGPQVGFPRFKKRGVQRKWRITTGSFGIVDDRHVRLPRIGLIRTKERTTTMSRGCEAGAARLLAATVKQVVGRWYVSFTCVVERPEPRSPKVAAVVGVDVGVRCLAVCSVPVAGVSDEHGQVSNPKHLSRYQRPMGRLHAELSRRQGPVNGHRPSRRWRQTKVRLARCHARVVNARADRLHKLTTALAKGHKVVVIEDLAVAGLTSSAKGSGRWRGKAGLNRAILDGAPAEQRAYRCATCGLVMDRDRNAAANLASLAQAIDIGTASGAETGQETLLANGRGEERSQAGLAAQCSSLNRQGGTGPQGPDRTATVAWQRATTKSSLIGSAR